LAETVSRSLVNALDRIVFDVFLYSRSRNRDKKEWKMSGEEKKYGKPCPRHKTATMIAYRSSLPNNRRQRQGQCTTAKTHSMLLPLSSKKNYKLSGDTVE
jgi:hypothetical protein